VAGDRAPYTAVTVLMSLVLHAGANAVSYDELRAVVTPEGTDTHLPVAHHEIVELVRYTLGFYGHEIAQEGYRSGAYHL
jgi:hypothetical protein